MRVPKCSKEMLAFLALEKMERKRQKKVEREQMISRLKELIADIARVFEVDMDLIQSGSQQATVVLVRKIFYYIGRHKFKGSYLMMANIAGKSDHCSVIFHLKNIPGQLKKKESDFHTLWSHYLKNTTLFTQNDFDEQATTRA